MSDLHFWQVVRNPLKLLNKRALGNLNLLLRRRHQIKTERATGLLDLLKGLEIDAFLVGGDLTTTATEEEFRQAADFLGQLTELAPVYLVPGNHDVYTFESRRKERLEKYCFYWLPVEEGCSVDRLPGDVALLRISTARPNWISSRGHVPPEALALLPDLLQEEKGKVMIALAHYPVIPETEAYVMGLNRGLGNGGALRRTLGEGGRSLLYLAGHVHVYSHLQDPLYPSLEQITTPALFYDKSDKPGGFTEIVVEGSELEIRPWVFDQGWQRVTAVHSRNKISLSF
jgi:DNA repair exonuclease SbcCD nuclease subunit